MPRASLSCSLSDRLDVYPPFLLQEKVSAYSRLAQRMHSDMLYDEEVKIVFAFGLSASFYGMVTMAFCLPRTMYARIH